MSKSPDAFRTISEVADWLGVQAHVLRFWESRFTQVKPVKRAGGRRYYRPNDMRLLGGIKKLLHEDGITIKGVQRILREQGIAHVASLSPALDDGSAAEKPVDDAVVIPFTAKPAEPGGQITLDLERPQKAAAAPVTVQPSEPKRPAAAAGVAGIATRAWARTEFDAQLLQQIAPLAADLRAVLNRIEKRSAG